jgi:hypothetical protein
VTYNTSIEDGIEDREREGGNLDIQQLIRTKEREGIQK